MWFHISSRDYLRVYEFALRILTFVLTKHKQNFVKVQEEMTEERLEIWYISIASRETDDQD